MIIRKRPFFSTKNLLLVGVTTFCLVFLAELAFLSTFLGQKSRTPRKSKGSHSTMSDTSKEESANDKSIIIKRLLDAGISQLSRKQIDELPTWQQVVDMFGNEPVIHNLESCAAFREKVPEVERMLGSAGMFSTGTNLVTRLLKGNCYIPARLHKYGVNATKEELGMRFQVPYGKHTPQHYRYEHSTEKAAAINKDHLLPVVTIRNPWTWMQSMCKNPYTAKWPHFQQCPNLRTSQGWNKVDVKYAAGTDEYQSLAHLYNDWYHGYYKDATYPFVMIRMEDLVFHTKETITKVCECAGGRVRDDRPFLYVTESAKNDSPGHDTSTGLVEAMIKYSRPFEFMAGFTRKDYEAALEALDSELMGVFQYQNPRGA